MIDLQLHTTDSDGTWPWDKVLIHCQSIGLKAFAITDHDTTARRPEILAWAKTHGAEAIPGIELSTTENGQTVHLLGYFLEGPLQELEKKLVYLRKERGARNKKMIARLQQLGMDITEDDVQKVAGTGTVGRPHIARVLLQKGRVQSFQEAFDRFLSVTGLAYFPKAEIPLKEAIALLHEAGAVTSVAHPLLLKRSREELEQSLEEWRSWGMDGVEAYYPSYSPEQSAFILRLADKLGFIKTGGSDFHGENKPYIKIGIGKGSLQVPDSLLEPLYKRRDEILKRVKTN